MFGNYMDNIFTRVHILKPIRICDSVKWHQWQRKKKIWTQRSSFQPLFCGMLVIYISGSSVIPGLFNAIEREAAEGQGLQSLWQPETWTVWLIILCVCPYVFVFALALATKASILHCDLFFFFWVTKCVKDDSRRLPAKSLHVMLDHISKIYSAWLV